MARKVKKDKEWGVFYKGSEVASFTYETELEARVGLATYYDSEFYSVKKLEWFDATTYAGYASLTQEERVDKDAQIEWQWNEDQRVSDLQDRLAGSGNFLSMEERVFCEGYNSEIFSKIEWMV